MKTRQQKKPTTEAQRHREKKDEFPKLGASVGRSWILVANTIVAAFLLASLLGCSRSKPAAQGPKPTAFGTAIAEVSGGKQVASVGSQLDQPLVVQVNDDQGNGVTGAAVTLHGPAGVIFTPSSGLTDASGQFTATVSLGETEGRYRLRAMTPAKNGKRVEVALEEIALGYQQNLGSQVARQYCVRCHDPESTRERVSNFDNLDPKPHAFTDGAILNKLSDADLTAIITHGGPALGRSPQMPPYGSTLTTSEIHALVGYLRAVADPPYHAAGVVYAQK